MKYFKIFNTAADYTAYAESEDYIAPNVSTLRNGSQVWISQEKHDYSEDYFTIESIEDNNVIMLNRSSNNANPLILDVSTDGGTSWQEVEILPNETDTEIATLNYGEKALMKNVSGKLHEQQIGDTFFKSSGNFNVEGNIMSLTRGDNFKSVSSTSDYEFSGLLKGCTKLISARNLVLEAKRINVLAYAFMFSGCTSLTESPIIQATSATIASCESMFASCTSLTTANKLNITEFTGHNVFFGMFSGCTNLTTVPKDMLQASASYSSQCYLGMFAGCTSLVSAPDIPNTKLDNNSCNAMFSGCTSLRDMPTISASAIGKSGCTLMFKSCTSLTGVTSLLATSIDNDACYEMFFGCTSLETVPNNMLPATNLSGANRCYESMFNGCTSLTVAPSLPATVLAEECYAYMFQNCSGLTTAPTALPATTLYNGCYREMFGDCPNLVNVPSVLPATTAATNCYRSMFIRCTSLTSAPRIDLTTTANSCCMHMFNGCTSLTAAPDIYVTNTIAASACTYMFSGCTSLTETQSVLSATTVGNAGYLSMFDGCTSLTSAPKLLATSIDWAGCKYMFYGCTSLETVPKDMLPALTLSGNDAYNQMFNNCTSLTVAPDLPATTLSNACYGYMFSGCTSLTTAMSDLPATSVLRASYEGMFGNCTSLTVAPEIHASSVGQDGCRNMFKSCINLTTAPSVLSATTLGTSCYSSMFMYCKKLVSAQTILPATTLATSCYNSMFRYCDSFVIAPELPATTLVEECYRYMFDTDYKLRYIKMLADEIPSSGNCINSWVAKVESGGTFVKSSLNTTIERGWSGIPNGWNIYNDTYIPVTSVTLSTGSTTIDKDDTYTLTATVLPNDATDKAVVWSTSDSSVATVDSSGIVTAVGCGDAIITVTTNSIGYTAQCEVSVEKHVTSVDLNTYILTVGSGSTYQLVETILPSDACDKSVTWSSSDSSIASVDSDGLVSGVTTGSATVTVTTIDGGYTKNCSVTVSEAQHPTGVTLSDSAITVPQNNTYTLTATVLPADAVNKNVTWSSSDSNIATVDSSGVVSGVTTGSATVTVTTVDGGYTAQCSVSVTHNYSQDYFTIESLEDNNTITMTRKTGGGTVPDYVVSVSTNDGESWSEVTIPFSAVTIDIATIDSGEKVMFKYVSGALSRDLNTDMIIGSNGTFNAYGNIMSLSYVDFVDKTTINGYNQTAHYLFIGSKIVSAENLILPATTLYSKSYTGMFSGCTSLIAAPELPATSLSGGDRCYESMFKGCTSLTVASDLPATTLSNSCYAYMFSGCTSLTTAPTALPATTLYDSCYREMFGDCSNLVNVPSVLPATTAATNCYRSMFIRCTSLTSAPRIDLTTTANLCCAFMFQGCTSLTTAPEILETNTIASSACTAMFNGCTSLTETQSVLSATTIGTNGYYAMFQGCTSLTAAPDLPATTLGSNSYNSMFNSCTSLTGTPSVLSATTLEDGSYAYMFSGCTSLTTAPTISATTLGTSACTNMFFGCTSLVTVQSVLPATNLSGASLCYASMFNSCTSLTVAPSLPATVLADRCYSGMFRGCTSLIKAPDLLATTLTVSCYDTMFQSCSKLKYIKMLAEDISANNCLYHWVLYIASTGTFVKKSATTIPTGINGIPTGWTVYDETYIPVTSVTLSSGSTTLDKDDTYTLTATVLPNDATDKTVVWSTSDSSVATVSDGVITAVGCGNAIITVTSNCIGYTAQCSVTVEKHVTSVDLNTYVLNIGSGSTYQLVETVSPNDACDKSVTWSSSDSSIASVDSDGLVSGVTTGSATVTVTTVEGGYTAQCAVTVNEPIHATGVTLNDSAITVPQNNTYTLTATVLPADAVNKNVTWSSSDSSIATVDSNGVVSGVTTGSAIITVTTVDGGYTAQCEVNVTDSLYTELEYIESTATGGQYIDLDIKLYETLNSWYDIAIKYNVSGKGRDNVQPTLFGCQDNNSPWPGTFIRMNQANSTNTIGRYIGGTSKDNTLGNNDTDIELPVQTGSNKNVYNLNNSNKTHNWGTSLFCAFSNNSNAPFRFIAAKLYYFKLFLKPDGTTQGTLVRDMMPCRRNSDNVVGLLDKVNNVFYTNPSGDAFVAGPEVNL